MPDTCEPLPGAATPLWGSGSSLSVVAILSLLVVLCWGPEALGHDSPPTRAQARELAQMSRVLHLRGGRVTPANLPDLDACLVSFGAGDLKHVAVHLREAGESAKRQREAVEAVWYARHVVQGVVDAPSITVGLAKASPEGLANVMVLLLRNVHALAMPSVLEHLSKDGKPEVRAMVGWVLPAYWHLRGRDVPAEKSWARGVAYHLIQDRDPRVISAIASHLLHIPDPAVWRALLRHVQDAREFESPATGFLSWGTSPLGTGVQRAFIAHLRFRARLIPSGIPDPPDIARWIVEAGGLKRLVAVDDTRWLEVSNRVVTLGVGESCRLRENEPILRVKLMSFSVGSEAETPNMSCRLSISDGGETLLETGTCLCPLGSGTYTTVSGSGPVLPGTSAAAQAWRSFVLAVPARDQAQRLRVVLWVNKGASRVR